ncbi:MAG: histidinol phosphate phosphatase domain-containing protein [Candidatus Saganbacteria bacterium]|nr:histidinol phosphate phosphatase domain-containing protein [Candidatus Saganbacteria bacterium]
MGQRIDFHIHSIFSDGNLLPAAIAREAEVKGHSAIAITDHVDASNLEQVLEGLTKFVKLQAKTIPIKVIPGVEISYLRPDIIEEYAKKARKLGAKIIIVHGESPVEPVIPGTNHTAVRLKGLVDILVHPGNDLTLEDAKAAALNGIYLELSSRKGHTNGNKHVAEIARAAGAKLLVNTDSHDEKDLLTQEGALQIALDAGLTEEEAIRVIKDNPEELLKRI